VRVGGEAGFKHIRVRGIVLLHVPLPCAKMSSRDAEHGAEEEGEEEQG